MQVQHPPPAGAAVAVDLDRPLRKPELPGERPDRKLDDLGIGHTGRDHRRQRKQLLIGGLDQVPDRGLADAQLIPPVPRRSGPAAARGRPRPGHWPARPASASARHGSRRSRRPAGRGCRSPHAADRSRRIPDRRRPAPTPRRASSRALQAQRPAGSSRPLRGRSRASAPQVLTLSVFGADHVINRRGERPRHRADGDAGNSPNDRQPGHRRSRHPQRPGQRPTQGPAPEIPGSCAHLGAPKMTRIGCLTGSGVAWRSSASKLKRTPRKPSDRRQACATAHAKSTVSLIHRSASARLGRVSWIMSPGSHVRNRYKPIAPPLTILRWLTEIPLASSSGGRPPWAMKSR